MNRMTAFLAVLAILPFAGLTACGSDDSDGPSASASGSTTAAETTAAAPAATTAAPTTTTTPATKAEVVATCHKVFDPFIANLRKINREVSGQLDYKHYRVLTRQLMARYTTLNDGQIPSASCQNEVNMQISNARLIHVIALLSWEKCRKEGGMCAKVIAELKTNRRESVKLTNAAVRGFRNVVPS